MLDKKTFKRELIRMWDSLRATSFGEKNCTGVICEKCPLLDINCESSTNAFEMIEIVEKWAKENPQKKFKISKMEYDILQEVYSIHGNFRMYQDELINNLREKGYFKGSYEDTEIEDYLKSCEVVDDN